MEKFRIQQNSKLLPEFGKRFSIPQNAGLREMTALVHVIHDLNLPRGVHLRHEPLYAGFTVGWSNFLIELSDDTLVALQNGDSLKLFGFDGSVVIVENVDGHCTARLLAVQDALQARLDLIVERLNKVEEDSACAGHTATVRKQDGLLHEIALMLGMSAGYPAQRNHILMFAERLLPKLVIRPGVREHFEKVLCRQNDPTFYGWIAGKVEVVDEKIVDLGAERQRRGAPADEVARKKARADDDHEVRKVMKGPSTSADTHGKGNKKGDDKKKARH